MAEPVEVRYTVVGAEKVVQAGKDIEQSQQRIARAAAQVSAATAKVRGFTEGLSSDYANLARQMKEQGISYKEIARFLGLTEEQVRKLVLTEEELIQEQEKIAKAQDETTTASEQYRASLEQQYPTLDAVIERQRKLRMELDWIKKVGLEAAGVTQEQVRAKGAEIGVLDQVAQSYRAQRREVEASDKAQQKLEHTIGLMIKRFFLVAVGARTFIAAMIYARRELLEHYRAIYENTQAYKDLTEAQSALWDALIVGAASTEDVERGMSGVAALTNRLSEGWLRLSEIGTGLKSVAEELGVAWLPPSLRESASVAALLAANLGLLDQETAKNIGSAYGLAMAHRAEVNTAAMATAETASLEEEQRKYNQALHDAIDSIREYNRIEAEHAEAIEEIEEAYRATVATVELNYKKQMKRIAVNLAAEIEDINEDAAEDREEALRKANDNLVREQKRAYDDLARMIEQHQLEMLQEQQRYELSMIQNERIYQYTRSRLVAEGDVLAIEDLDARHELEQQAQKENFELQMQQAEAMFQLQLKYQQQAIADQVQALRAGLRDELAEIEKNRRDRIDEAKEGATEERWAAFTEKQAGYADAKVQREEDLEDQRKSYGESLQALAQRIVEEGVELGKSYQQIDEFVVRAYGADSPLRKMTAQAYQQLQADTATARDALVIYFGEIAVAAQATAQAINNLARAGQGLSKAGGIITRYPKKVKQYGGEDIVSAPTIFTAGEAYQPERVIIQPLSSIGGNMALSWHGGPIPIQGTGELTGIDMSSISNVIAQSLVAEMTNVVREYRGQRGR